MLNYKHLDWRLNLTVLFLIAAGLASLASTNPSLFYRQLLWLALGLVLALFVISFDWRPFVNYRFWIFGFYFIVIALLVAALIFAPTIRGTKSWLRIGSFQFEPSELMKLALIVFYSRFFSRRHAAIAQIPNSIVSFIYFAGPAALIIIQPDFGSAAVLFSIWLGYLLVSGIPWRHLLVVLLLLSILGTLAWDSFLKPYQKERILGFLFPTRDPLGINYSVIQAKIAIGSAGLFGKGFKQGTQTKLGFLTEQQTDFIFAAFIEEWGVLAGLLLVAAFIFLIFEIIKIGLDAQNNFSRFVCLGAAILFVVQFILNIGSNLGLTPVIGATFPFFSYGGSSILTNFILLGIIQSIYIHRSP